MSAYNGLWSFSHLGSKLLNDTINLNHGIVFYDLFPCRPLNAKIHQSFSVLSRYEKSGEMKWVMEKGVLAFDFIAAQLDQCTTSYCIHERRRGPSSSGQLTTFTVNHQPLSTILRGLQGILGAGLVLHQQMGLYLGPISLDAVPYLIRQLNNPRPQGKQKFANTYMYFTGN